MAFKTSFQRERVAGLIDIKELLRSGKISREDLYSLLSRETYSEFYKNLVLHSVKQDPKLGKKSRFISEPISQLMDLQRFINKRLEKLQVHPNAFAYAPGRSSVECVGKHLGAVWALKVDLADFFHSIDEGMVVAGLRQYGFTTKESTLLARIVTALPHTDQLDYLPKKYQKSRGVAHLVPGNYEPRERLQTRFGYLPQGAPTSGLISNIVFAKVDEALHTLARKHGLIYTRYSDDMLFSAQDRILDRQASLALLQTVGQKVGQAGFSLNHRKTRILTRGARFSYLGLLFDGDKLRIPAAKKRNVTNQVALFNRHLLDAPIPFELDAVAGYLSYALQVEPDWASPLLNRLRKAILKAKGSMGEEFAGADLLLNASWNRKLRSRDKE